MGLLLVPLCYLTVWELVKSTTAAFITGMMLVCGKLSLSPSPLSLPSISPPSPLSLPSISPPTFLSRPLSHSLFFLSPTLSSFSLFLILSVSSNKHTVGGDFQCVRCQNSQRLLFQHINTEPVLIHTPSLSKQATTALISHFQKPGRWFSPSTFCWTLHCCSL